MSLNFDFKKIENWEKVCLMLAPDNMQNFSGAYWWDEERIIRGSTQDLIFAMMGCGIGPELTEKYAPEFYVRVKLMNALLNDPYHRVTPQLIQQHIGLHINVNLETRAKWLKRVVDMQMRVWEQEYNGHVS